MRSSRAAREAQAGSNQTRDVARELRPQRFDRRAPNSLKPIVTSHNAATSRRAPNVPFYAVFRRLIAAWRKSRA
ncbi:hypothetical protein F6X37_15000 [Paraburkholderia sp. 31.1]|nr:hypothetical protein [Paraburkholderia sp. 31.1]